MTLLNYALILFVIITRTQNKSIPMYPCSFQIGFVGAYMIGRSGAARRPMLMLIIGA